MSAFQNVAAAPPIEVFKLTRDFQADTYAQKVSLGVGAYRTDEGKPWILPVVKKAEKKLADMVDAEAINHEYLPVLGLEAFSTAATKMLMSPDGKAVKEGRAFGVQSLSGTGALRNGGEFLHTQMGSTIAYVSDPTWGNHNMVFKNSGFTEVRTLPKDFSVKMILMRSPNFYFRSGSTGIGTRTTSASTSTE